MIIQYTTTFKDFQAAQRLALKKSRRTMVLFLIFQRVVPVLALIGLALLIVDMNFFHFALQPWAGGVLFGIVWLGFWCPIARAIQIRRLYSKMKNGRKDDAPLVLELTDHQLISRVPGISEGRFFPSGINSFLEDDEVGLIYIAKANFLMLPKKALTDTEWQTLRNWLAAKAKTLEVRA
jgi:hypothetical protein